MISELGTDAKKIFAIRVALKKASPKTESMNMAEEEKAYNNRLSGVGMLS